MKTLIMALAISTFSTYAQAEVRTYVKTNASKAVVTIKTDDTEGTQAMFFVDAHENNKFLEDLLKDKKSELYKAAKALELEYCEEESTDEESYIEGCGQVTLTEAVQTSFGRGGWMEAGAGYTLFLGFTMDGTGRFFESKYMVQISEDVTAQVNEEYEYMGTVLKELSLNKVTKLEE